MILPPGFAAEEDELREDFDLDEDWSDEDLEEEPVDLFAAKDGDFATDGGSAGNGASAVDGATSEVDLVAEQTPETAEEATETEVSGDGAGPQTEASQEEPL